MKPVAHPGNPPEKIIKKPKILNRFQICDMDDIPTNKSIPDSSFRLNVKFPRDRDDPDEYFIEEYIVETIENSNYDEQLKAYNQAVDDYNAYVAYIKARDAEAMKLREEKKKANEFAEFKRLKNIYEPNL